MTGPASVRLRTLSSYTRLILVLLSVVVQKYLIGCRSQGSHTNGEAAGWWFFLRLSKLWLGIIRQVSANCSRY